MTGRIDFSRDAGSYDRRHGNLLPADAARRLAAAAGLRADDSVLEIGAGTGRVAIALAAAGPRVFALDPAQPMLDTLRTKSSGAAMWVQIREKARELFEQAGVNEPFHPGARSEADVDALLAQLGFVTAAEVRLESPAPLPLVEFLRKIGEGEYSYTWRIPAEILLPFLPELDLWVRERFDLAQPVAIPREIAWRIHRRAV